MFPPDFTWGIATSALQVEGGVHAEGRGASTWDDFAHRAGTIVDGSVPDVATDHFHRVSQDVALLAQLGVDAYRFSIAWPRIMPDGVQVNPRGFDFYDRLLDQLLAAGIRPFATLFHWDLPAALEDLGGWERRDTAERFADYSAAVAIRLGDRIDWWSTINEPFEASMRGYAQGLHAPGRHDAPAALMAAHHLLLGHARAAERLRAASPASQVGIVLNLYPIEPQTQNLRDVDLARRVDLVQNRLFLDPLLTGKYSDDARELFAAHGCDALIRTDDEAAIGAPVDFLGVNYYTTYTVTSDGVPDRQATAYVGAEDVAFVSAEAATGMGLPIRPDGLTAMLRRLSAEYPCPPLYITENGSAYPDEVDADGRVDDRERSEFLLSHVAALGDAIAAGVDVRGYFAWTLVDNFEWSNGFSQRFGLVYLDLNSLERTPKRSFQEYRALISNFAAESTGGGA